MKKSNDRVLLLVQSTHLTFQERQLEPYQTVPDKPSLSSQDRLQQDLFRTFIKPVKEEITEEADQSITTRNQLTNFHRQGVDTRGHWLDLIRTFHKGLIKMEGYREHEPQLQEELRRGILSAQADTTEIHKLFG